LPHPKSVSPAPYNARFSFNVVPKENIEVVYEINLLKFRLLGDEYFGTITDVDGQDYEGYEILFHTPGEHQL